MSNGTEKLSHVSIINQRTTLLLTGAVSRFLVLQMLRYLYPNSGSPQTVISEFLPQAESLSYHCTQQEQAAWRVTGLQLEPGTPTLLSTHSQAVIEKSHEQNLLRHTHLNFYPGGRTMCSNMRSNKHKTTQSRVVDSTLCPFMIKILNIQTLEIII